MGTHLSTRQKPIFSSAIKTESDQLSPGATLELRQIIQNLTNAQQKQDALEIVDAVEVQLALASPSKTVVSALLKALPHMSSIATLTSAIISAL
ncbi:hypothetical protein IFT96_19260 [Pseudomonas fluorescens]|nr:hypothetical protein [Pseudomonas fluorescens]MBS6079587.1 hypothetical protein [Pseudomonas fluorescens]